MDDRLPGHFPEEALVITYITGAETDCLAWAPVSGRQPWRPLETAACDLDEISYNWLMVSRDQADREEQLADVQEGTEQRMHSAADVLPDGESVHERAEQLSARAQEHRDRAEQLRKSAPSNDDAVDRP